MYLEFSPSGTSGNPSRNGMHVLTDMLVGVLYHTSSDVTLSDLVQKGHLLHLVWGKRKLWNNMLLRLQSLSLVVMPWRK